MPYSFHKKIYTAARERLEQRAQEGNKLVVVYVGPNDFSAEAEEFSKIFMGVTDNVRFVIVEPNLAIHPVVENAAKKNYLTDITLVHAALGETGELKMWWYAIDCIQPILDPLPKNHQDDLKRSLSYWSTTDKVRLKGVVDHFYVSKILRKELTAWNETYGTDFWEQVFVKSLFECIKPMPAPILEPTDFLNKYGLSMESVDILHVDAEGLDHKIMNKFLAIEGFHPKILKYEWTGYASCCSTADLVMLTKNISGRNYDLYQDHQDFVGILHTAQS